MDGSPADAMPALRPSLETAAFHPGPSKLGTDADEWASGDQVRVQPGIKYKAESSECTLGFVLKNGDGSALYALTAGHCVDEGVHTVTLPGGTPFGVVEAYEYTSNAEQDWGLIRILPSMQGSVSPSVKYWTGPTGVSSPGALELGDTVCWYGQGSLTFPDRCGLFYSYHGISSASSYAWIGIVWGGDSGSPMIDYATGQALGIATNTLADVANGGSTISQIFNRLAAFGYDLTLVTAPYNPPPAMPI